MPLMINHSVEYKMPLGYSIESRKDYLYVLTAGAFDMRSAKRMFRAMLNASVEHDQQNVLIDLRGLRGSVSEADRLAYIDFCAEQHVLHILDSHKPLWISCLRAPCFVPGEDCGEGFARTRDFYFRSTSDIEEALNWLDLDSELVGGL